MNIVEVRARDIWPGDVLDEGVEAVDVLADHLDVMTTTGLEPRVLVFTSDRRPGDGAYNYRTYRPEEWVRIIRKADVQPARPNPWSS